MNVFTALLHGNPIGAAFIALGIISMIGMFAVTCLIERNE